MKHEAGQPVRVLVVDDSRAQLALMVGMLRQDRRFEVVGTALDGRTAVDATARLRPHVVAMDIHLPQMDGYEATRQIMRSCPTPIVLVSSSTGDAQRRAVQALAAGALAVLPKPKGGVGGLSSVEQDNLLTTLRLMADVPVVTRHTPYEPRPLPPAPGSAQPQLLAIAASTGGPAALRTLLAGLGGDFPLPILVAQHISRGFVGPLAEWLDQCVSLSIKVALPEERLLPGTAYLAPDDCHLLTRARLRARGPLLPQRRCAV
jgi:two-component system, chemotaxis family, protein-glutamate methylesterase/glutaminase